MRDSILLLSIFSYLSTASTVPLSRRADGCGNPHNSGYNNNLANHQIGDRNYTIWVPQDYDPDQRWPLIVDFHGHGSDADNQHANSQYDLNPRGKEYLVAYPNGNLGTDGEERAWGGAPYATTTPEEDLNFITSLVANLKQNYCIDSNRIYASGKSNGGGFVDTLACSDSGDQFAAFAMAAPALYTDYDSKNYKSNCPKKRAILEAHGDKDTTICYKGNEDPNCANKAPLPDIATWVSWWGKRTCGSTAKPDPSSSSGVPNFDLTSYSCNGYESIVRHYHGSKMAHCWPDASGKNYDSMHNGACTDRSMNYTNHVMDFFEMWRLDGVPVN